MLKLFKSIFGVSDPAPVEAHIPSDPEPSSVQPVCIAPAAPVPAVQSPAAPPPAPVEAPAPAPVVSAPKPPSEHEQGEALRATAQWQQEVAQGKQAWDDKMQALMERLEALQESGKNGRTDQAVVLMLLASYYHLGFFGAQVLEASFLQALRSRIERDIAVEGYKKYITQKTETRWNSYPRSPQYYVEEFVRLRACFLDGFMQMIDAVPQMVEVVDGLTDQIDAAQREMKAIQKGELTPQFRGYLSQLAQAQLPGVRPVDFFPEHLPRYISRHYEEDIRTSSFLLLWTLNGIVRTHMRTRPTSTSQVGIEFEQRLMREISEAFPNARIEPTAVTGDQGADVVLRLEGLKIVIQAKRYTGVVGNAAVQEVFAAQQFYEADYALVVTTSRYTAPAQTLAQKLGVHLTTADDYLRRIQQLLV